MYTPNPQAEHIIRQELLKSARRFMEKRKDFATICINPACPSLEDQGKMKLEITKDGRRAHCWVCDWTGSWDSIAKNLGLQTLKGGHGYSKESYTSGIDVVDHIHAQLIAEDEEESSDAGKLPDNIVPWAEYTNQSWRGLSVSFLTSLGAQFWRQRNIKTGYTTPRILLPFMQKKELVGYTGRRLDDNTTLKYYNAPWAKARKILFPFDYVAALRPKTVVLVEGQIDALVLIQFGIPALCMMGTNNWSDDKRTLLMNLGIDNVYICMDGDSAGHLATKNLFHGTESFGALTGDSKGTVYFNQVENIVLPDGVDPGSLAIDQLTWLKNHVGV